MGGKGVSHFSIKSTTVVEKRGKILHTERRHKQRHRGELESGGGGQPEGNVQPKSKGQDGQVDRVETQLSLAEEAGSTRGWKAS